MSKERPLTPEEKEAMGEAAELIRKNLWLGKTPPPPPHPNDKPWSMARDLSIWKRLLFLGHSAEELNGAIENARSVLSNHDGVPLRMTIFYNHQGYAMPALEQAIGIFHKRVPKSRPICLDKPLRSDLLRVLGL